MNLKMPLRAEVAAYNQLPLQQFHHLQNLVSADKLKNTQNI